MTRVSQTRPGPGSRIRVSLGSGAGHGESTRDPGPTHLKGNSQRRPTAANEGQCRPTKTKKGPNDARRVVWAFFNVHFIFHFFITTKPTKAHISQRQPTQVNKGPQQPTKANAGPQR